MVAVKIVCECDQEIPQSQTEDNPMAWGLEVMRNQVYV